MSTHSRSNLYLGLFFGVIALFAIFVWIPLDTETGLTEKARRRILIGDALAPTLACGFILVGALLLVLKERAAAAQPVIARSHVWFLTRMLLRATPGWKHVGFVLGGVIVVSGMITIVERRFTRRAVLTALVAVLVMIAVFDLPFEDLMLPPNGDV